MTSTSFFQIEACKGPLRRRKFGVVDRPVEISVASEANESSKVADETASKIQKETSIQVSLAQDLYKRTSIYSDYDGDVMISNLLLTSCF